MARFGVNFNEFSADTGPQVALPDPGVHDFEITDVKNGTQSKGKNAGAPYFSAKCVQIDGETPGVKSTSKFLGLGNVPFVNGSNQIAQTKGFIVNIGLGDQLEQMGSEFDSEMLKGVVFRARVEHTVDNNKRPQAELYDVEPISHAQTAGAVNATQPTQPAQAQTQTQTSAQPVAQAQAPANQPAPPTAAPAAAPSTTRRRR